MNLQTWAEWVAQISALTGGGVVELRAGPGEGMTIAVRWAQDGKSMAYGHAISMHEMKAMYTVVQPCVLESITHAVRKMTPNAELTGLRSNWSNDESKSLDRD